MDRCCSPLRRGKTGRARSKRSGSSPRAIAAQTWQYLSSIRAPHEMTEPGLARLRDGTLVVITRSEGALSWSKDGGKTWTSAESARAHFRSVAVDAARRRVAVRAWIVQQTASGLRALVSKDGGASWTGAGTDYGFAVDPTVYGYSRGVELPDGSIYLVFQATGGHKSGGCEIDVDLRDAAARESRRAWREDAPCARSREGRRATGPLIVWSPGKAPATRAVSATRMLQSCAGFKPPINSATVRSEAVLESAGFFGDCAIFCFQLENAVELRGIQGQWLRLYPLHVPIVSPLEQPFALETILDNDHERETTGIRDGRLDLIPRCWQPHIGECHLLWPTTFPRAGRKI